MLWRKLESALSAGARIFGHAAPGSNPQRLKTGRKFLQSNLKGPAYLRWYDSFDIQRMKTIINRIPDPRMELRQQKKEKLQRKEPPKDAKGGKGGAPAKGAPAKGAPKKK